MFSWGEDSQRLGARLKRGSDGGDRSRGTDGGVQELNLGYDVTDLAAGSRALAFVKSDGKSFVVRETSKDGRQKFVKCREKIRAVCCADDDGEDDGEDGGGGDVVMLLSEKGKVLCVDATHPNVPRPMKVLRNIAVCQVACGNQHSVALTKDGQVYTWGRDSRGQLGLGGGKPGTSSPQHLRSLSAVPLVQIAAGGRQSFALSISGAVFGWGRNHRGQLGLGDTTDRDTPTPVLCLNMKKTIHISCGMDHTAVLTKNGAVFTFGSGQYGQLGHNSFRDEPRPRLVAELWGAKVTEVACGRHHTLVLTDSRRVYSFGRGEQGQLGRRQEGHPSVPLPVQLPPDTPYATNIRNIFAGGNCSYATCMSNENVREETNAADDPTPHRLEDMIDRWTSGCDWRSWETTRQEICMTFSSASCINASFLEQSKDKHFQTSPKYSGLDLSLARLAFKKLLKKADVFAEVEAAVLQLLPSLDKDPVGVEGLRIYLLLIELLHGIQRRKRGDWSVKLAEAVASAVLGLSADGLQVIGDWWSSLPPPIMETHVKVWTRFLSVILYSVPVPRGSGSRNLLQVLQFMYDTNSRTAGPQRLPESDFCVSMDEEFLYEELQLWRMQAGSKATGQTLEEADEEADVEAVLELMRKIFFMGRESPLILCSFPSLMDLKSKKFVLDRYADLLKEEAVEVWKMFYDSESELQLPDLPLFVLDLRRASVLEDTFEQLPVAHPSTYKFPLVVYYDKFFTFDNFFMKDFFYEVFHEMVSAESGMFMFNDAKTLAWFPSEAKQEDQRYFHFGVLCGLALYNRSIIYLPFPLALFKKLLGVKPSQGDMMEFSPCIGESLLNILEDYSDNDIENLYMDFSINWDGAEVDLDPEHPEKPLTGQNKKEFVEAYVNHAFNTSVEGVFQEFKRGFFQVCDQNLVELLRPNELQEVMVGKDFHDWEKLKQNTTYEGVYKTPSHPTIDVFWEVFDELTEDQKKAFLWFVTGFERLPITGTDHIKMKVKVLEVKDLSYDQYYPQSHTCYSTLELPLYSTKEVMQTKLMEALSNGRRIYK